MLARGAESQNIPPTKDALVLHTQRVDYQAYLWRNALDGEFTPKSPVGPWWQEFEGQLNIHWRTKEPAPKSVLEQVSCNNCKKCSNRRCPFKAKGFKCTDSCVVAAVEMKVKTVKTQEDTFQGRMRILMLKYRFTVVMRYTSLC